MNYLPTTLKKQSKYLFHSKNFFIKNAIEFSQSNNYRISSMIPRSNYNNFPAVLSISLFLFRINSKMERLMPRVIRSFISLWKLWLIDYNLLTRAFTFSFFNLLKSFFSARPKFRPRSFILFFMDNKRQNIVVDPWRFLSINKQKKI